jgi:hypothetical protein
MNLMAINDGQRFALTLFEGNKVKTCHLSGQPFDDVRWLKEATLAIGFQDFKLEYNYTSKRLKHSRLLRYTAHVLDPFNHWRQCVVFAWIPQA